MHDDLSNMTTKAVSDAHLTWCRRPSSAPHAASWTRACPAANSASTMRTAAENASRKTGQLTNGCARRCATSARWRPGQRRWQRTSSITRTSAAIRFRCGARAMRNSGQAVLRQPALRACADHARGTLSHAPSIRPVTVMRFRLHSRLRRCLPVYFTQAIVLWHAVLHKQRAADPSAVLVRTHPCAWLPPAAHCT